MKKSISTLLLVSISLTSSISAASSAYVGTYENTKQGITLISKEPKPNTSTVTSKKVYKKFQPVELIFENKTQNTYKLHRQNIELPVSKINYVKKSVKGKYFFPIAFVATAAFLLTPAVLVLSVPLIILVGGSVILTPILGAFGFLISLLASLATFALVMASPIMLSLKYTNSRKKSSLKKKTTDLTEPLVIKSGATIKRIIYIPKEYYKSQFELRLKGPVGYVTFDINMF